MKKLSLVILLYSLSLALGFSAYAQKRVAKNELHSAQANVKKVVVGKEVFVPSAAQFAPQTAKSVVVNRYQDMEYAQTMWTYYDLQSNQYCANRMYQLPDGSVAAVATMSHEANQVASDRGTGYNFYRNGDWHDEPMERIESFKTGWPSIAQWGSNGEILVCHGNGHLQCFTRSIAGQGPWINRGPLPDHPVGYPYNDYASWPRVVTSGDNHNIIHVIACLQHTVSDTEGIVHTVLFRSEDATNWEVSYGPLQELGYEQGSFSADDYCMAANGHNVAILYSGCLTNSVWMFKSANDGMTWETIKVWEHPFENVLLDEPNLDYGDTLFMPMNGAIAIDNNGVVHVALNSFEMTHLSDTEPGNYSYYYGRMVDGILYWNDTQEAPMRDTYHPEYIGTPYEEHFAEPNPFHVARLWWPVADDPGYVHMLTDSTKWIGWVPMYQGADWDNNKFYHESDYRSRFYGTSGHPALSIDPQGNIACAYSTPCMLQENESDPYYKRHIYVSYRNVDVGYWNQIVDDITDSEEIFELSGGDNIFTISVPNTVNNGEFWFGFQSDYEVGLYWGSNAQQATPTENGIFVMKVIADPEMVGSGNTYTINATANPANGGSVTGGGQYPSGSTCTLHAYPNSGYSFLKWTKNGTQVSTNPDYSFTVTGNASYVAHFQQGATNYTITVSANPTNTGTVTGGGSYQQGQSCTVTATANSGYTFTNWTENGSVVSSNASYTFTVNGNRNLVANFNINSPVVNNDGPYCVGETIHLTANSGASGVSYSWIGPNGFTSSQQNPIRNNCIMAMAGAYTCTITKNGQSASASTIVTIYNTEYEEYNVTECDSYTWHGTTYTQSGNYVYNTTTEHGCVRTETLHLTVSHSETIEFMEASCESYIWHGTTYTTSGDYTYNTTTPEGCERIETLHLTISDVIQTEISKQACDSYTWNGQTYNTSGDYTQQFTSVQGCDSIVTLHLTISDAIQTEFSKQVCESYTWNGQTYNTSGDYTQQFASVQGCDSIVTLHLTISDIETESFNVTECDTYPWHGTTYTESGVYTFETITPEGCQRIETLYLTINPSETEDFTMTAVESYTWHGTTYTESGDYTYETTTAQGCPRIETLHLTITHGQEFYTIIASAGPNGRIQPEGEVHVEPGGLISFTITPDPGCAISQVIIDGVEYAPIETVAFSNVHGDHTLQALFWGVGVEENEMPVVKISPNPAQKEALVECEGMRRVELYSLSGVKVFDQETQNDTEWMALDGLSSGMYVVKVVLDGGYCQYAKLIVSE